MKALIGFCFFCLILMNPLEANSALKAHQAYLLGEKATSLPKREEYFNEALKHYSKIEGKSAKLYYNMANCYYQLDQAGIAIWYYYKAQALAPRDKKITQNLIRAQKRSQVQPPAIDKVLSTIFFFHTKFLSHEKKIIFYSLLILTFILGSLFIWLNRTVLRTLTLYLLAPLTIFGVSLSIDYLNRYSKAVLVQPSLIRCDAGTQYKEVSSEIELAGQKVKVLQMSQDQEWVKIKTSDNKQGYVAAEKIRML